MTVFYTDVDESICSWLTHLVANGLIPEGVVVNEDISNLQIECKFQQCHFFAGIAGWSLALQLACWPDNIPVWTGSCPCQPFSVAGSRKGFNDKRHLWPEFKRLIDHCRPPVIFGEQVASPLGRQWLSRVRVDLEESGYAVGCADLCAASVGAPHRRQRLFWVAYSTSMRFERQNRSEQWLHRSWEGSRLGITNPWGLPPSGSKRSKPPWEDGCGSSSERPGGEWVECSDDKLRRFKPGVFPLAYGIPRSMGKGSTAEQKLAIRTARNYRVSCLKAYGNAIVPQVAAKFIRSLMDVVGISPTPGISEQGSSPNEE